MLAIIGIVFIVIDCILVRLFDDEIRAAQWRKAGINVTFIAGVIMFFIGIIIELYK